MSIIITSPRSNRKSPDAERIASAFQDHVEAKKDTPDCDADRIDDFYSLQQLAFLNYLMNGDGIALLPEKRWAGEDLYSGMTPAQRAAKKLMEEYAALNDAAVRREEYMCAEAIKTGIIHVEGPGVKEDIDFDFTNKVSLTGNNQWGKSAAKVLENLEEWVGKVLIEGFANVDTAIMGKDALRAFLGDEDVMKKLDNRRVEMGVISPRELAGGVSYIGHLNKPNLDIYQYAGVYLDDWTDPANPAVKPLVDDNMVILISSASDFVMAYGACSYYDESQQLVTAQTPRLMHSYIAHNPERRVLQLDARPLPIPDKVDSWLVATVC